MVRAELKYNPYLLKTEISFNGNSPRVNSLVEKYLNEPLQVWIQRLPEIFRDEMNGYDFELEFSGTEMDFIELEKSFRDAGVNSNMVRLSHTDVLESRDAILSKISELRKWLKDNRNDNFDYDTFRDENAEL